MMDNSSQKRFSLNYKKLLLDEIALDGLEGIGIEVLWKRIEKRISTTITSKIKTRFWTFLCTLESIFFYEVEESPPSIEFLDRFMIIDEVSGYIVDPPDYLDGPYEWCPIENEYGSCSNYDTRTLIPHEQIKLMTYEEMLQYGDKLVLVASIEERWHALAPHLPITYLNQLTPIHYGLLELIGRGRENGQMTIGKTNLSKIVKEAKLLFYNRNVLQKLDLIKVYYTTQVTSGKAMKSILLRLKRFHKPTLGSLPKVGMIANMVNYLLEQPDHRELNDVMIKKGFMNAQHSKRFQKTMNVFTFEDRKVKIDKPVNSKSEKQKELIKKKFISLTQKSDESSQSDGDDEQEPLKCQYKVGVGIMRQAYERFLDAGRKGLTQTEIAQILGVEFYTSRSICRVFKAKNLVREFLEDKGRQRTARYIAVATTKEIDKEYTQEKNKLLEHVQNASKECDKMDPTTKESSDSDSEIPIKKIKLKKENRATEESIKSSITEVKVLDGYENITDSLLQAKKNLTLRQLKFANGILKVVKDLKFVIGFQTLSMLASKEIGEPPMDTKALKLFLHKLMRDGQVKVLKLKRPNKCSFFICAPNVKATDAIIRKKYKEICAKAEMNRRSRKNKTLEVTKPHSQFIYQRYVKIQMLHEFITKFVYFNENRTDTVFLPGFASLLTIIPEMTVEFALGNINNIDTSDVIHLKLNKKVLSLKIREIPEDLNKMLLQSKSLQNSIRVGLKIMAVLGLIQLIQQPLAAIKKEQTGIMYVFYVNRRAKILDTSGKWPRPADESGLEKSFYFETFEDVKTYWQEVINISSNTTINVAKREWYRLVHPMRNEHEVDEYDNGERYGDGLGPCGFDSSIFMDMPRSWRTSSLKTRKGAKLIQHKSNLKIIMKRTKKPKLKAIKDNSAPIPSVPVRKRKQNDSSLITWSKFEDKILMLCKAAITIMSPVSQPGCLRVRNTAAKDLLTITDPKKTAAYCHKRSLMLDSNSVLTYEKDCIVSELRRRRSTIKKYEGLLKALRLRHYGNITKYINEARLPILELIWLVYQIEQTKPYMQRVPCIALNFEDFNKNYTIAPSSLKIPYNVYKTPATCEPEFATLKEGIILSVMLSLKNQVSKEIAKKIYATFEVYPETTLRSAVEQLRKAGAIAARDKVMNNNFNKVHFDDIVESSYKISVVYRRKWINKLETEFIENLSDILNSGVPQKGLKGSCELNCLLCEMNAYGVIDIVSDTIPVVSGSAGSIIQEEQMNVIDMETKYKLKSGLIGWESKCNVKNFTELYDKCDHKKMLDSISKDAVVTYCRSGAPVDIRDPIILYLETKREKGSTFSELQEHLSMDRTELCTKLKDLEANKVIKRIGYYENLITLTKYAMPMLLQVEPNFHIIPTPWLTLDAQIQYDVFIKWTSVIVNKVFESPGCSIEFLSSNFECITIRSVQDICMFLEGCKCVVLRNIEKKQVDLFSEDDDVPDLYDFNPYDSPDQILVFPVKNFLTKYAYVRKRILNEQEISE